MAEVEISYTLTLTKELLRKIFTKNFLLMFRGMRWVLYLIMGVVIYFFIKSKISWLGWYFFGVYSTLVITMISVFLARMKLGVKRIKMTGDGKWEMEINEDGIWTKSSLAEAKHNWNNLNGLIEIKEYLLLVSSGGGFLPVPKSVLTPESTAWIKEKIGKKEETGN